MHVPLTEVILTHDGTELARATLPPGEYVIGREVGVDLHADTPLLSRQHARLTINYDHLLLEDLGSSNGTFVNEQPVAECTRLFPNQSIRLGPDITLEVRRQRAPTEPGVSLAPAQAAIRRHLPEKLLADKRYAIGSIVAQGGMGAILDARQSAMKRTVAMKVMLETSDEAAVLRFIDEAQITGQLDHPNIVPIHELGVDEQGQVFYTMKMVRGINLKKVLADLAADDPEAAKKYPLPALLTVFQKVCDALAFAHAKGVIHRDLKPENIMLGDFGSVLVMDWGLAKVLGGTRSLASHTADDAPAENQGRAGAPPSAIFSARAAEPEISATMAGAIMGTPAYMSPEQARGEIETLDARSDVYALGAILFELLALRPSVTGGDAYEVLAKVAAGEVGRLPLAGHPDSLVAVVHKAMAFDRAARYANVAALQADIAAYQGGFATSAERAGFARQFFLAVMRHKAVAAAAVITLLVGAGFGTKAVVEGRRAEKALDRLRGTAPTFAAQAEALIGDGKFDDALGKLAFAIELAPETAGYHLLRGRVLQTQLRLGEAGAAFRAGLERHPSAAEEADARANLALCERLHAANPGGGPPKKESVRELHAALLAQRRTGEALTLARHGIGRDELIKGYEAKIVAAYGEKDGQKARACVGMLEDDTLLFNPSHFGLDLTDLRGLQGMPFSKILMPRQQVSDLSPLAGMPLRELDITRTKVRDLSPLQGAPLKVLDASYNDISDLSPLAGMPLGHLDLIGNLKVRDITPLRGMPLRKLKLLGTNVTDFTPLLGMPLEYFETGGALRDLRVLSGMPLKGLRALGSPFRDLSPLIGMPLEYLDIGDSKVEDLTPLRGMPLKRLQLGGAKNITDFGILSSLPLEDLALDNTTIRDLTLLRGLHLKKLSIAKTAITDLAPLRGMPLDVLCMDETAITDLTPLLDCPTLKEIILPGKARNIEILRQLPHLKRLSFRNKNGGSPAQTAAEFWVEYDAQQAAGKK